jgi:hypothetical protein
MTLKKPINENYAAIVVEIKTLVPLQNCDNVQHAIILGNQVVVGKDVKVGDIGLYFPLETQLSESYLKHNNLYRKFELNIDNTRKGYFEENGRIRCVKFRGNKSEGLFMPIDSILFTNNPVILTNKKPEKIFYDLNIGDCFDELNGVEICRKYVIKHSHTPGHSDPKQGKNSKKYESKLIDDQFKFHSDTSMLYKNLDRLSPNDLISITYKIHGTSFISSKILCKKRLKWYEKFLKIIGVKIIDTQYDYVYSSRKVIKNSELNPNAQHFYSEDIWEIAHNEVKDFLVNGLTIYGEIAGFLSNGSFIQKDYDYGCEEKQHKLFIYRITYTNTSGKVFEFSAKQVQDFCQENGLNAVPQVYYGFAKGLLDRSSTLYENLSQSRFQEYFLAQVKEMFNEHDCFMCRNKVPEEGVVLRFEKNDFEAFKAKSNRFYERETKLLDKGESNIEDDN